MSPEQCRAARAWLGWSQAKLASKAHISGNTVRDFESGRRLPHPNNLLAIQLALEAEHMVFTNAEDGAAISVAHIPPDVNHVRDLKKPKKAVKRRR